MPKITPKRIVALSLVSILVAAVAAGWTWDDGAVLAVFGWKWGRP